MDRWVNEWNRHCVGAVCERKHFLSRSASNNNGSKIVSTSRETNVRRIIGKIYTNKQLYLHDRPFYYLLL